MENERHFDQELDALRAKLSNMGAMAGKSVMLALEALHFRNDAPAQTVIQDDDFLDRQEMEVDEESVRLLSKAPLASDLRLVCTGMKISRNLERVGDEATTIARQAIELNKEPAMTDAPDLAPLAQGVLGALNMALLCFQNRDVESAAALVRADGELDELNRENRRALILAMTQSPDKIHRALRWITISKCLERVGDHASNIAESVVFLYQARDIRHTPK
jgi:phosphate transport system protein